MPSTTSKAKERLANLRSQDTTGKKPKGFYPTADYPKPGQGIPLGRHVYGEPPTSGPGPLSRLKKGKGKEK